MFIKYEIIEQIKTALSNGAIVYWSNDGYQVKLFKDEYYIIHRDGLTTKFLFSNGDIAEPIESFYSVTNTL